MQRYGIEGEARYFGRGFVGGGWYGNAFRYNTAVVNVNTTVIRNTYVDRTVVVNNYNTNVTRVSYNGGDGVRAVPTEEERSYISEPHLAMTAEQRTHMQAVQHNRNYLASVNQGHNRPENFARINDADRASGMSMQSHATTNGQAGYHPEQPNRPQQQYRTQQQFRTQPQPRPAQQYRPQRRPQAVQRPAPHPRSTGRPR